MSRKRANLEKLLHCEHGFVKRTKTENLRINQLAADEKHAQKVYDDEQAKRDLDVDVLGLSDDEMIYHNVIRDKTQMDEYNERKEKMSRIIATGGFSKHQLKLITEYSVLATYSTIKISSSACVKHLDSIYSADYAPRTTIYCSQCCRSVKSTKHMCSNGPCVAYRKPSIKHTLTQKSVVVSVQVSHQLQNIVERHMKHIVKVHRFHHNGIRSFEKTPSTTSLSRKYSTKMESPQEFAKNQLCLPFSVSFDGFVSRRHSRSETTPFYVRLEGLPAKDKRDINNVVLAALHRGFQGVKASDVQIFVTRVKSELESMVLEIECCGRKYEVKFKNMLIIADLKGLNMVFGFPCWRNVNGCPRCDVVGEPYGKKICFGQFKDIELLSEQVAEAKILQKIDRNVLLDFCSIIDALYDDLHCYSEGAGKNNLRDVFTPASKWLSLRVSQSFVDEISAACSTYSGTTTTKNLLVSLVAKSKQSGCDIRESVFVVIPLVASNYIYNIPEMNLYLFGLVTLAERLMRNSSDSHELKAIGKGLKYIHLKFNSHSLVIKFHILYDHAPLDYEYAGCIRQFDSSDFEKHHRDLQINLNPSSVKLSDMMQKFIMRREMNWRQGIPERKTATDQIMLCPESSVSPDTLCEIFSNPKRIFANSDFQSRCVLNNSIIVSSSWSRRNERTSTIYAFEDNRGATKFGELLYFEFHEITACAHIIPIDVTNGLEDMGQIFDQLRSDRNLRDLVDIVIGGNDFFYVETGRMAPEYIKIEKIKQCCSQISFRGKNYIYTHIP